MHQNDTARAADALRAIPPDLPRDEWVRAAMGAHAAGLDFDDFDQWSAQAGNYDAAAARDTWRSIKPGAIGPGTLFRMAAEHGHHADKPQHESPSKPASKPQAPPHKPAPGMSPAEVWSRAQAATAEHGYIAKKGAAGVPLDGLRVLPQGDPLRIRGASMAGALLLPGYGPDGELQTLQCIPETGDKMNLSGCPMAGARHIVGEPVQGAPLYVVEGIGAAWAVWQATGRAAVVAFGWGNVARVVADLRQREASARLVICPDTGKEDAADSVAREHGCTVAKMPEGWPSNSDVGDLAAQEGADVLAELLESAQAPDAPEPLLKPVSVGDVLTDPAPPPRFVWDGYAPRGVVTLLGAHGGTGKSTVALMLAVCAVLGRPLFEVDTEHCAVVFASLEDGAGVVRHRLAGICSAWGIDARALHGRLHIVDGTEHPELFAAESRGAGETTPAYTELRALVQSVGAGLVIVDNASDAYGGDEIQRRQVRAFMRALAEIAREADASVLLLAHVDKNTSRARKAEGGEGYSGSTAWHNSARSRLFMSRGEDGLLTLEHQKSNLGKLREPLMLVWPHGGLPEVATSRAGEFADRLQGRADDERAAALLRLIAEFESRGQYCGTTMTARNNPHAMLKSEPAYVALKLRTDDTRRIVNQCQRAGWLSVELYRTPDRKEKERWAVTPLGRSFAGIAPCAPSPRFDEEGAESARGAPCAPSCVGGVGESARAEEGAQGGANA